MIPVNINSDNLDVTFLVIDTSSPFNAPALFDNISDALDYLVDNEISYGMVIDLQYLMIYQYDENFELKKKWTFKNEDA